LAVADSFKISTPSLLYFLRKKSPWKTTTKIANGTVSLNFLLSETLSPRFKPLAGRQAILKMPSRRDSMHTLENALETELQLDDWFEAPTHEAAVEMMQADAVVPFGTAMWP
jgi:hypothetical protein